MLIGPVVVILALIAAALYRPVAYELNATGIKIVRSLHPVDILFQDIRSINSVTSKELGFGLRIFGSGGFLGYFGKFYYREHGWIQLYATDRNKMLLITLHNDKKVIISPDDTEAFMRAFREVNR